MATGTWSIFWQMREKKCIWRKLQGLALSIQSLHIHSFLLNTYRRCVESGVQSGRYLAPISRAFSLSSPLKGFWKPLRTNTTPSMIRLNGTCCTLLVFTFCCLGLGLGLDELSLFLSADFCAGEAGAKMLWKINQVFQGRKSILTLRQ